MTKISHHLTEELLIGYSAGTLPEAFNLVVAAHISMCDECRAAVESYDALGGLLVDEAAAVPEPARMSPDSLAKTLRLIELDPAPTREPQVRDTVLPAPVVDYVGGPLDAVKWSSAGMGVKQAVLSTSAEASARLLYIPAGTAVPDHGHCGTEITLVLQGAFSDDSDRFARGDVEVANQDMVHTPVAETGEDCICLAVTDAPLKFRGILPRLAQPFLKI